jgi:hypothetical protein
MGRSTGRIFEPRSSRWNGYHGAICFTFYLFQSFLSWRLSVFGNADQFWRAFFFFISSRFLVIFRSFSCSVVFSLDITAGPAGGSRVKICHRLPRRLGRKRMGEPGCPAGSTFSRAWWRTDKPIWTLLFHPFAANSRRGMIQYTGKYLQRIFKMYISWSIHLHSNS